ncbi:transmembrane protein 154 isoform X3 [Bos javanicus]|uniref:transmembrane protein 154 isoform X3 n=1 Tax=Bos javanicus TaxID=9906 RepID=UPI002AA87C91|nr:transmembrane protein 154 isoform X3 [Bos javanicus]
MKWSVCSRPLWLWLQVMTGEEDTELSGDALPGTGVLDEESEALSTLASVTTEPYITNINVTLIEEDTEHLEFILMVLIPVLLLSLLLLSAILLVIYHKRKRNKQEPSSQGSQSVLQTHELGSENVKVPIFEEDTPSVMEIEMEELDKWMNSMNRNGMWCGITEGGFFCALVRGGCPLFITMPLDPGWDPVSPLPYFRHMQGVSWGLTIPKYIV